MKTTRKSRKRRNPNHADSIALSELKSMTPYFAVFSGVVLLAFAVFRLLGGDAGFTVLTGLVAGNALSALNFYLMGLFAGKLTGQKSSAKIRRFSGFGYGARYLGMFAVLGALIHFGLVHPVAAVVPLLFPSLYYKLRAFSGKTL